MSKISWQTCFNSMIQYYKPSHNKRAAQVTASAFYQLDQYAVSPGNEAYRYADCHFFSTAVAMTISSTHCTHPCRDGQAEL